VIASQSAATSPLARYLGCIRYRELFLLQGTPLFGVAFTMGRRPNVLPKDAFKTRMAVALIKRGDSIWTYKVEKVTAKEGTLTVTYAATSKDGGGTARFASPLIVSIDKGDYSRVVFVENGKTVETIKGNK